MPPRTFSDGWTTNQEFRSAVRTIPFPVKKLLLYFVRNNWVGGLNGRTLTEVVTKVRTQRLTQLLQSDRKESDRVTSWPRSVIAVRRWSFSVDDGKYENSGQNQWVSLSIILFSIPYLVIIKTKFSPVEEWLSSLPLDLSCCVSVECKYYVMVIYWCNVLSTFFF